MHAPSGVGKGHGNRITKPPSAKQRANLRKYNEPIAIAPRDAGMPSDSWWTKYPTRAAFDAAVAVEVRRMKLSRIGRLGGDTHD